VAADACKSFSMYNRISDARHVGVKLRQDNFVAETCSYAREGFQAVIVCAERIIITRAMSETLLDENIETFLGRPTCKIVWHSKSNSTAS
jgi:hypothetical protein